jgi:prepilin-type N-terminal cleavage/methylation domain-containing protein
MSAGDRGARAVRCTRATGKTAGPAGFSLVEVLMASAISLAAAALACGLAFEAQQAWRVYQARMDLQQRARVAADRLTRALLAAGAGPHAGDAVGPLGRFVAPILPRRTGRRGADPPDRFRTDAFTVVRAASDAEPGRAAFAVAAGAASLDLAAGCDLPSCGIDQDSTVLLLDALGRRDAFTVLAAAGATLTLRHHGAGSESGYPAGTPVLAADVATFYLDGPARTLRTYDGDATDAPLVDEVVAMEVEYYGDLRGPVLPRPPAGTANCLYESDGTYRAALLPALRDAGGGQARLTGALLVDGPWCGAGASRFDADLLRLRRVKVTVRLQASDPAVRGPDRLKFRNPGHASRPGFMVPDTTIVLDVRPRNLRVVW